jgi:hypothetical protein
MHSNRQFSVSIQGKSTVKSQGDGGRSSVEFFVEGTQMTVNRTKPTKAELHKMLAEAVLNNSGRYQAAARSGSAIYTQAQQAGWDEAFGQHQMSRGIFKP